MGRGREILPSDIDAEIDFADETCRKMYARRLAPEISGQKFVTDPENVRSKVLDREDAVEQMERILKYMNKAEHSAGTRTRRGLIDNQERFEAVAGRPIDEALEEAYQEYEIGKIARWVIS